MPRFLSEIAGLAAGGGDLAGESARSAAAEGPALLEARRLRSRGVKDACWAAPVLGAVGAAVIDDAARALGATMRGDPGGTRGAMIGALLALLAALFQDRGTAARRRTANAGALEARVRKHALAVLATLSAREGASSVLTLTPRERLGGGPRSSTIRSTCAASRATTAMETPR